MSYDSTHSTLTYIQKHTVRGYYKVVLLPLLLLLLLLLLLRRVADSRDGEKK